MLAVEVRKGRLWLLTGLGWDTKHLNLRGLSKVRTDTSIALLTLPSRRLLIISKIEHKKRFNSTINIFCKIIQENI